MTEGLDRPGTDAEKTDAGARLEDLRKAIQNFHKSRLKTGEMLMGLRPMKYSQAQAAQIVRQLRDQSMEQKMVDGLRTLNRLLLQREPTVEEMEAGLPPQDQLGFLPALPLAWSALSLAAIGGGAWTLTSYFNASAERERRLQRELNPQAAFWSDVANTATRYGMPVALLGGGVFGVWWLWKKAQDKGLLGGGGASAPSRPRALPRARTQPVRPTSTPSQFTGRRNTEPDEDEDEGEEEEEE